MAQKRAENLKTVKKLPKMINYPKVATDKKGNVFVCFKHNQKRYRLYNGSKIGIELKPNTFPINERFSVGKLLAAEVFKYFQLHNKLISNQIQNVKPKLSDIEYIKQAYLNKKNLTVVKNIARL